MDLKPSCTIYINNVNEEVKKEGSEKFYFEILATSSGVIPGCFSNSARWGSASHF